MNSLPKPIVDAIDSLSGLPGIGTRSAERLVMGLLRNQSGLDQKISENIGKLKRQITECEKCFHFCEGEKCGVCQDAGRNQKTLCIVETPIDLIALERTHEFRGVYHVLHGVISPLNKVGPENLRMNELMKRVKESTEIDEVILALSGSTESDATGMYIVQQLKPFFTGKVSRLARGIPSGGDLDYLDMGTLSRAISERREF